MIKYILHFFWIALLTCPSPFVSKAYSQRTNCNDWSLISNTSISFSQCVTSYQGGFTPDYSVKFYNGYGSEVMFNYQLLLNDNSWTSKSGAVLKSGETSEKLGIYPNKPFIRIVITDKSWYNVNQRRWVKF